MRTLLRRYRKTFFPDLLAGLTGAVAGAPQAMGFAIVAGISPVYGLYSAFIATIVAAIFGSSTYLSVAPTNALALVVGSTLLRSGGLNPIEWLFVLTLLVGIFQLLFGLLRLGFLTRFVSNAVMTGFITGAGVLIILGQLSHITGYHVEGETILLRFWDWLTQLHLSDGPTVVVGVGAAALIFALHHTRLRSISTLIVLILTTVAVLALEWESVALVRDESSIAAGLPMFVLPDPRLLVTPELLTAALAMAVLASVQSAAITQAVREPNGTYSSVTRDFVGQGMANIVSSFFQGMPSGGSLSRTAVNVNSGARTRWANIFAGAFVGVILLVLGPFIERITLAALAGHLVIAAVSLISLENIRVVWQVNPSARAAMVVTFISTLVLPLEYSIYLGVLLSLGLYIYTSADNVDLVHLIPDGPHRFREAKPPRVLPSREPIVLYAHGHLYFAAVRRLEELMPDPGDSQQPVVILRLRNNHYLGSTGIRFLVRYAEQLRDRDGHLFLTGINGELREQLERTGALQQLGEDSIFYASEIVFGATEHALAAAQAWLDRQPQPDAPPVEAVPGE